VISHLRCPVCDDDAWSTLGSARFVRDAAGRSDYERLRDRVLFELWAKDAHELVVTFCLCEGCGFVTYLPRPSEHELSQKYAFLSEHEPRAGRKPDLDRLRSKALAAWVEPSLDGRATTLLDLGGGRGELLSSFVAAGHRCCVVDFDREPLPGVAWAGSSLDALPATCSFGAVIASHVLEHLADPLSVARALRRHLQPDGFLFVEVPLEILGGPPRMREPVTHVSFFCESSLRALLERSGFAIVSCQTVAALFASGAHRYAVRAVARRDAHEPDPSAPPRPGAQQARKLLRWQRALMALGAPELLLPGALARAALRLRMGASAEGATSERP
jgi:2-polyprenyl-3-methyl-5-hydroxy-6-metoxy-1,4-benzoquinol methylase